MLSVLVLILKVLVGIFVAVKSVFIALAGVFVGAVGIAFGEERNRRQFEAEQRNARARDESDRLHEPQVLTRRTIRRRSTPTARSSQ